MAGERISSPQPPKQTDNVKEDVKSLFYWAHDWWRTRVIQQRLSQRLDAINTVAPLTQTIDASPTQAQVQAIQDKINEIIAASR